MCTGKIMSVQYCTVRVGVPVLACPSREGDRRSALVPRPGCANGSFNYTVLYIEFIYRSSVVSLLLKGEITAGSHLGGKGGASQGIS